MKGVKKSPQVLDKVVKKLSQKFKKIYSVDYYSFVLFLDIDDDK